MYRSTQTDSIWNWEPLVQIGNHDASDPMPILSDNGDIYLFFRRAVDGESATSVRSLGYIKSSDHGSTWSYFNNIIDNSAGNPNNDDYKWLTTIYNAKVVHESADGIYPERFLISWILAGRNADGSGYYDSVHRNVYFAYLNLDDHIMYSANQASCGSIVDYNDHMNRCLVFDSGNPNTDEHRIDYITIPSYDLDTNNHLVAFESQHSTSNAFGINIAVQNGASWTRTNLGQYNAINDLERWDDNRFRIYLKQSNGNVRPIKTLNGWQTWSTEDEIVAPYEIGNVQLISNPTSAFKGIIKTYDDLNWANANYTSGYHNYTFGF
ncbi:hypothetical protein [Cerasicoccus frondis]|uniref:hypothetical protein n=1 Tax=Cerasicoccus frondis TaxID=490090 RepID=UPI0028526A6E|nr:hypothetical protein [Cerasicoccus frondis]